MRNTLCPNKQLPDQNLPLNGNPLLRQAGETILQEGIVKDFGLSEVNAKYMRMCDLVTFLTDGVVLGF